MRSVANLKGFKIASLNVNSLLKHIDEIRHVLFSAPFDIFAINESKIDELTPDNEISIPGYNPFRKDRNRAGGSVVLYIRDNISFSDREDLVPSSLETVCAEINRPHSKRFLVYTWYRPPNSDMELFNECEIFFQRCDAESRELILVGDLNCDVSKVSLDPHTRQLIFLCSLYQIVQLIDKPTRVADTSVTMIDLVLTNVKENIHASELFVEDLSKMPWNAIQQVNNPNTYWNVRKSFFTETLNRHTPIRHKTTRRNFVPWITTRIKDLMRNSDYHKKTGNKICLTGPLGEF